MPVCTHMYRVPLPVGRPHSPPAQEQATVQADHLTGEASSGQDGKYGAMGETTLQGSVPPPVSPASAWNVHTWHRKLSSMSEFFH